MLLLQTLCVYICIRKAVIGTCNVFWRQANHISSRYSIRIECICCLFLRRDDVLRACCWCCCWHLYEATVWSEDYCYCPMIGVSNQKVCVCRSFGGRSNGLPGNKCTRDLQTLSPREESENKAANNKRIYLLNIILRASCDLPLLFLFSLSSLTCTYFCANDSVTKEMPSLTWTLASSCLASEIVFLPFNHHFFCGNELRDQNLDTSECLNQVAVYLHYSLIRRLRGTKFALYCYERRLKSRNQVKVARRTEKMQ